MDAQPPQEHAQAKSPSAKKGLLRAFTRSATKVDREEKRRQLHREHQIGVAYLKSHFSLEGFYEHTRAAVSRANLSVSSDKNKADQRIAFFPERPPKNLHKEFVFQFRVQFRKNSWRYLPVTQHLQKRRRVPQSPQEGTALLSQIVLFSLLNSDLELKPLDLGQKSFNFLGSEESALHGYGEYLAQYLDGLLGDRVSDHDYPAVLAFLGISNASFYLDFPKTCELRVFKHSKGRRYNNPMVHCLKSLFPRWQERWMVVGRNHIRYYKSPSDPPYSIRDNVPFDSNSQLLVERVTPSEIVFVIRLPRRRLRIKVKELVEGLCAILGIAKLFEVSEYTRINCHSSFAPARPGNAFDYFIDGKGYFERVHQALERARKEVLICGWMISPEMPLRRPVRDLETEESRLDRLLLRAARRGVNVYVLVYKEFNVSMYNDSEHAVKVLGNLHKRIKVMKHPNKMISLWSHHEKLVVVDRETVFMGGLDLAWGRWDTCSHDLLGAPTKDHDPLFPGVDYYNPLIKDFTKGRHYKQPLVDKYQPRMPWHDVAAQLTGPVVKDFVSHFVSYWNHARESNREPEVMFNQIVLKDAKGKALDKLAINEDVPREIRDLFAGVIVDEHFMAALSQQQIAKEENDNLANIFQFILNKAENPQYFEARDPDREEEDGQQDSLDSPNLEPEEEDEPDNEPAEVNEDLNRLEVLIDQEENNELGKDEKASLHSKRQDEHRSRLLHSGLDSVYKKKVFAVPLEGLEELSRPPLSAAMEPLALKQVAQNNRHLPRPRADRPAKAEEVWSSTSETQNMARGQSLGSKGASRLPSSEKSAEQANFQELGMTEQGAFIPHNTGAKHPRFNSGKCSFVLEERFDSWRIPKETVTVEAFRQPRGSQLLESNIFGDRSDRRLNSDRDLAREPQTELAPLKALDLGLLFGSQAPKSSRNNASSDPHASRWPLLTQQEERLQGAAPAVGQPLVHRPAVQRVLDTRRVHRSDPQRQEIHLHREPVFHFLHQSARRGQQQDQKPGRESAVRAHPQSHPLQRAVPRHRVHPPAARLRGRPREAAGQSNAVPGRPRKQHHRRRPVLAAREDQAADRLA